MPVSGKRTTSGHPLSFWYALDGQAYADRYEAKMATMIQALMHQGSHGALVS